jgi:hypothetical protein
MRRSPPPAPTRDALAAARAWGGLRTALIGFGVAALTWLLARSTPVAGDQAPLGLTPAWLVAIGLATQFVLIAARAVARRTLGDEVAVGRLMLALELVADGITVLLFALAMFGAVFRISDAL